MIQKPLLEAVVNEYLKGTKLSLAEISVSEDNDIEVIIRRTDGEGVSIDDCADLSRYIESRFDRDKEDFSLMVGSAGIEE
ncbi:MAG: hypothetical protein KBS38_01775 [Bacteroidales bacterium]|nr:hypothetical protein [Candidatus Cacconaster caballi]